MLYSRYFIFTKYTRDLRLMEYYTQADKKYSLQNREKKDGDQGKLLPADRVLEYMLMDMSLSSLPSLPTLFRPSPRLSDGYNARMDNCLVEARPTALQTRVLKNRIEGQRVMYLGLQREIERIIKFIDTKEMKLLCTGQMIDSKKGSSTIVKILGDVCRQWGVNSIIKNIPENWDTPVEEGTHFDSLESLLSTLENTKIADSLSYRWFQA